MGTVTQGYQSSNSRRHYPGQGPKRLVRRSFICGLNFLPIIYMSIVNYMSYTRGTLSARR